MIPVFLIQGFLESGKTKLIKETIMEGEFYKYGRTLLIVCEDGEISYNELELFKYNTDVIFVEKEEELTIDFFTSLDNFYRPNRIIIETNSMWGKLKLPKNFIVKQNICLVDYTTFAIYIQNMRQIMTNIINDVELVLFNRCELDNRTLIKYKRNILAINPNTEVIFQNDEGQIDVFLDEELPYDIKKENLVINENEYGIFFIDSMQNQKRYENKIIQFASDIMEEEKSQVLYAGRNVMNCCVEDIAFWGHPISSDKCNLKHEDYGMITVKVMLDDNNRIFYEVQDFYSLKKPEKNYLEL